MPDSNLLVAGAVVLLALTFDYINGFHDTANAIATVVSTRVLRPRTAIGMAAALNFVGALLATHVAETIAKGLVSVDQSAHAVVLAAVLAGIVWNLVTWKYGIPSSSSHALVGGLCGAAFRHGGVSVIHWGGLTKKVLIPLVASPTLGFLLGGAVMVVVAKVLGHWHPGRVGAWFRRLQVCSAAFMALSHGQNDAQKSMGIITLGLFSLGYIGSKTVPLWVMLACALAMALGTSAGGWRIIKTMGHRIIRLDPVHGFAAETSAATVITLASFLGMPVSTTHVIAGSIFGVGASQRLSAVRWGVALNMVAAWVTTLPASFLIGALCYDLFGWIR
ncbi:MAG: anion permease [Fimbriimonadaceae bacterium]